MSRFISKKIKTFSADKKGVTMLEYGLIATLIALICLTAITSIGTNLNTKFGLVATALK